MPNWKKVVVADSNASFNSVTTPSNVINDITASYAINASTTAINSGTVIAITPASTTWTLNHSTNERYPIVTCWESGSNEIIQPDTVRSIDINTVEVTFTTPIEGFANVSRAGHVISGSQGVTLWTQLTGPAAVTASGLYGGFTGSLQGTASYAINAPNAESASFASTASFIATASNAISSSYSVTSSYAVLATTASNANTASLAVTASYAVSSSYAVTASYANSASNSISSSYATTASWASVSISSSYALSSSYAISASNTLTSSFAETASYWSGSIQNATSASVAISSSWALSSSNAATASYWSGSIQNATSASYSVTASYWSGSIQNATSASYSISSSNSLTSSYAATALTASNALTASYWSGSIQNSTSASVAISASNALTASFASTASFWSGSIQNATSASVAITASYALTASRVELAQTASFVATASHAIKTATASYADSFVVANNLTVNGTASISYLKTTFETASVIYSSGSSKFGDTFDDVMSVTGSMQVSGSIIGTLTGTASWARNAVTASYWSGSIQNATSASYSVTASHAVTASYWSGSIQNALSASYSITASYWSGSIQNATSASVSISSSWSNTASFASTASYWSGSIQNALSSSYSITASYWSGSIINAQSSSFATTASYWSGSIVNAQSASFATTASWARSASFATTASYWSGSIQNALSSSYSITASYSVTSSYTTFALSSSNAATASAANDFRISGSITSVDWIDFNTASVAPTWKSGRVFWDNTDGALSVYNAEADVTLQVGQENWTRVRNNTGTTITNGTLVRLSGAQGDVPTVTRAQSIQKSGSVNTDNQILGVATHDIETNSFGYITTLGLVRGLNTSTFNDGDNLFVGTGSAGVIQNTAPQAPFEIIPIGVCVKAGPGGSGIIYVAVQQPVDFSDLSSVQVSGTYSYGDLWSYQQTGSVGVWRHTNQLSGSYAVTGSWSATSFTGSLRGTASYATTTPLATTASYAVTASYWSGSIVNAQSSSFATTASYWSGSIQNALSSSYAISASWAPYQTSASFASTASYWSGSITNATSASIAITASYALASLTASYAVSALSASHLSTTASNALTASYSNVARTASFWSGSIQNATSASVAISASWTNTASFSATASFVNTLNQNILVTGSMTIGTSSFGPSENTLTLGARDTASEGGQLGFNAPGGTWTSASMLDVWQNQFRVLRGTNAGSDAVVASFNLHSKQVQFPAYNSVSSFPGSASANLAVDTNGNIITVSTTGGTVFPYVGNAVITGSLTTTGIIYAQPNGGKYFQGGDDAGLYDINVANTMGIYGEQTVTEGAVKLGSDGPTLYGSGSRLGLGTTTPRSASFQVNGNIFATSFTGSLLGTAATASFWSGSIQNATSASVAISASWAPTTPAFPFTGSARITGSLSVTGSVSITGSLTMQDVIVAPYLSIANYPGDAEAAAAGIPLWGIYRTGNMLVVRMT